MAKRKKFAYGGTPIGISDPSEAIARGNIAQARKQYEINKKYEPWYQAAGVVSSLAGSIAGGIANKNMAQNLGTEVTRNFSSGFNYNPDDDVLPDNTSTINPAAFSAGANQFQLPNLNTNMSFTSQNSFVDPNYSGFNHKPNVPTFPTGGTIKRAGIRQRVNMTPEEYAHSQQQLDDSVGGTYDGYHLMESDTTKNYYTPYDKMKPSLRFKGRYTTQDLGNGKIAIIGTDPIFNNRNNYQLLYDDVVAQNQGSNLVFDPYLSFGATRQYFANQAIVNQQRGFGGTIAKGLGYAVKALPYAQALMPVIESFTNKPQDPYEDFYKPKFSDNLRFATGGNVPVEAEGQEVVEEPNGNMYELQGASHEQGGIDMNVPEGSQIYSKRLKGADGKTMAERKKFREQHLAKLQKLIQLNPNDKLLKKTYEKTLKDFQKQDQDDLAYMNYMHQQQEMAQQQQAMQQSAYGEPQFATGGSVDNDPPVIVRKWNKKKNKYVKSVNPIYNSNGYEVIDITGKSYPALPDSQALTVSDGKSTRRFISRKAKNKIDSERSIESQNKPDITTRDYRNYVEHNVGNRRDLDLKSYSAAEDGYIPYLNDDSFTSASNSFYKPKYSKSLDSLGFTGKTVDDLTPEERRKIQNNRFFHSYDPGTNTVWYKDFNSNLYGLLKDKSQLKYIDDSNDKRTVSAAIDKYRNASNKKQALIDSADRKINSYMLKNGINPNTEERKKILSDEEFKALDSVSRKRRDLSDLEDSGLTNDEIDNVINILRKSRENYNRKITTERGYTKDDLSKMSYDDIIKEVYDYNYKNKQSKPTSVNREFNKGNIDFTNKESSDSQRGEQKPVYNIPESEDYDTGFNGLTKELPSNAFEEPVSNDTTELEGSHNQELELQRQKEEQQAMNDFVNNNKETFNRIERLKSFTPVEGFATGGDVRYRYLDDLFLPPPPEGEEQVVPKNGVFINKNKLNKLSDFNSNGYDYIQGEKNYHENIPKYEHTLPNYKWKDDSVTNPYLPKPTIKPDNYNGLRYNAAYGEDAIRKALEGDAINEYLGSRGVLDNILDASENRKIYARKKADEVLSFLKKNGYYVNNSYTIPNLGGLSFKDYMDKQERDRDLDSKSYQSRIGFFSNFSPEEMLKVANNSTSFVGNTDKLDDFMYGINMERAKKERLASQQPQLATPPIVAAQQSQPAVTTNKQGAKTNGVPTTGQQVVPKVGVAKKVNKPQVQLSPEAQAQWDRYQNTLNEAAKAGMTPEQYLAAHPEAIQQQVSPQTDGYYQKDYPGQGFVKPQDASKVPYQSQFAPQGMAYSLPNGSLYNTDEYLRELDDYAKQVAGDKYLSEEDRKKTEERTNQVLQKQKSTLGEDILDAMPTLGDMISLYGKYRSATDPYNLTMQQRAGDTPNINPYENYGQRGLNKMEETKLNLQNNLDQAIQNNQLNANAALSNANSNARSINTARAMELAIDAQQRQADNQAYQQYADQVANVNARISQMLDRQDQMRMMGNSMRDLADRQDRDNHFKQLQRDVANRNWGIQEIGRELNDIQEREFEMNAMNNMSHDFKINKRTGQMQPKGDPSTWTEDQKYWAGKKQSQYQDYLKTKITQGYFIQEGTMYNKDGEEVDINNGYRIVPNGKTVDVSGKKAEAAKKEQKVYDDLNSTTFGTLNKYVTKEELKKVNSGDADYDTLMRYNRAEDEYKKLLTEISDNLEEYVGENGETFDGQTGPARMVQYYKHYGKLPNRVRVYKNKNFKGFDTISGYDVLNNGDTLEKNYLVGYEKISDTSKAKKPIYQRYRLTKDEFMKYNEQFKNFSNKTKYIDILNYKDPEVIDFWKTRGLDITAFKEVERKDKILKFMMKNSGSRIDDLNKDI